MIQMSILFFIQIGKKFLSELDTLSTEIKIFMINTGNMMPQSKMKRPRTSQVQKPKFVNGFISYHTNLEAGRHERLLF